MQERRSQSERSQRGTAMVLVLIFGIGALGVVSLVLTLADQGTKEEGLRHEQKTLQHVLKTGFACAMYEVNKARMDDPSWDPDGHGTGAILGPVDASASGGYAGVPVTDSRGRVIGRFRTTFATVNIGGEDKQILTVVAAYPDFVNPREVASAQMEVAVQLPGYLRDRNAISIIGDASGASDGSAINLPNGSSGHFTATDPNNEVPAVNITDLTYWNTFTSEIGSYGGSDLSGADPSGGGAATGNSTVDNTEAGVINNTVVTDLAASMDTYAAAAKASGQSAATILGLANDDLSGDLTGDPDAVYYLEDGAEITGTLTGEGTLVVEGHVDIESGSSLNWTGTVLVVNTTGSGNSRFHVKGQCNVTGMLAIQGVDGDAYYEGESGGRLSVDGVLFTAAGTARTNEMILPAGHRVDVNGLFIQMGDGIDLQLGNGGGNDAINVTGSMIFAIPDGATGGLTNFSMASGGGATFTFNNGSFTAGVNQLREFISSIGADDTTFPLGALTYFEGVGTGLLTQQSADIVAAGGSNLGYTP